MKYSADITSNASANAGLAPLKQRGFAMIELLIVVALIAMASGLVTFALRDPAATRLEQEAGRLTALLESARAEARASGLRVIWEPVSAEGTGNSSAGPTAGAEQTRHTSTSEPSERRGHSCAAYAAQRS